jgi:hypothetical protein
MPGPAVVTAASTGPQVALPTAALTARIATRISRDVDRRLRLAAVLRDARLGEFPGQLLDQALPTAADLAAQMNGGTRDEC